MWDNIVSNGGGGIAATGIIGVFLGLLCLFVVLTLSALVLRLVRKTMRRRKATALGATVTNGDTNGDLPGEVIAAIAASIYLDVTSFDEQERAQMTIKKVTKPYSPWFNSGKNAMLSQWASFGARRDR